MARKPRIPSGATSDLRSYPVLSPLDHDNEPYAIGETVEMDEGVATPLIAQGVLGPAIAAEPAAPGS